MRTMTRLILAGLVLAALMGSAPVATAHWRTPAGLSPTVPVDLIFIDMMIPHHESAIAMAYVALTKGEHKEVRDLARAIIRTQEAEVAQLRAWRNEWYPDAAMVPQDQLSTAMHVPDHEGAIHHPGDLPMVTDGVGELHALTTAEGPFDRAFLRLMIPHHESAVTVAQAAMRPAVHPEIKHLAQNVIDGQGREITEMRAWLAAWYGERASS